MLCISRLFINWGILALRIGVGVIFLIHGIQKRVMWKTQPSEKLSSGMLSVLRLLSIAEPLGGAAILVGFLTRPAAAGICIIMVGGINRKASQ